MQKVLNIISVLSFLLVLSITGGGIFGYLWITNEENQEKDDEVDGSDIDVDVP